MTNQTAYRLLLVDDDEDEFVLTQAIVNESSALGTLDWVDNYDTAAKVILQEAHDCYLIDYYLGSHNGVDLLRAMRAKGCRAPIIILTGRDGDGIDIDALEAGATDYLEKALLTPTLLDRAVRYAIRQQENQNRLEDLVEQVSHLEQIKTDMIRIAAHDLRNPLTVMTGYLEILGGEMRDTLQDSHLKYIEQMRDSVRHMRKMVSDILSLERISELTGGHTEPVQFSLLVEDSFNRLHSDDHTMTLAMPSEPVIVYGADTLLQEAIDNLISNAVKYTPTAGKIAVSLSSDADSILFRVQDSGFGIPADLQPNLFQPFFRAKTRETRKIQGTGLGLHLVQKIVQRHNGQIIFESEHGSGSTFGFMLPQVLETTE